MSKPGSRIIGSTWRSRTCTSETPFRYRPDFVVRLTSGLTVLLEGKGDPNEEDDAKATAARRWVQAVNTWGGLGTWTHHICYDATSLKGDLLRLMQAIAVSES